MIKLTIARNEEKNGIELTFSAKPSKEVIAIIKASKFRFHGKKKLWYAKANATTLATAAKLKAMKTIPAAPAPVKKAEADSDLSALWAALEA